MARKLSQKLTVGAAAGAAAARPADRAPLVAFARLHDWDEIARRFVAFCLEDAA